MNRGSRIDLGAASADEMGIRGTSGGNLVYTNGQTFRWFGSGVLDKPIEDFINIGRDVRNTGNNPYFAERFAGHIQLRLHRHVIPEPEEYALVFGLFALGFVFFRHFRKKTRNENI